MSWITVHGRTKDQRNQPVNLEAIRTIKDSVSCPVIANGDVRSLDDVERIADVTGVNGKCSVIIEQSKCTAIDSTKI